MATTIEAKSLSSITAIAAEPPSKLDSNSHNHEPLTLYIARVPGSQDVFLSTMKPREKVVTAQDVESCLYYCHLDCDRDETMRESLQSGDDIQDVLDSKKRYSRLPPDQSIGTVKRKPLPRSPVLDGFRPDTPPKVFPHLQAPGDRQSINTSIGRKPVRGTPPLPSRPLSNDVSPTRKPLGPRPLESMPLSGQIPSPYINGKENVGPPGYADVAPALPPRTNSDLGNEEALSQPPGLTLRRNTTDLEDDSLGGFSLTIIRRDPTSGDQWNIGKVAYEDSISSSSIYSGESNAPNKIKVEIHTPGYEKFLPPQHRSNENASYQPFERLLSTQRMKNGSSASRKSVLRPSIDFSRHSGDFSVKEMSTVQPDGVPNLCFLSPWNGICEFSTGASGRTLKCRHSLPSINNEEDAVLRRLNSAPVSELRLNLPVLSSKARPPLSKSNSKPSFFSSSTGHRHSVSVDSNRDGVDGGDEWDDTEEMRMDLSLGQERAGGGFGGKKAKLGKLIVEGEGLMMLDLVVAANMGFWWNLRRRSQ